MREIRHENLVQIIGACVDDGNIFILMEYYNRGSLQDVLMNYDIKLDQMFISSLVADILRVIKKKKISRYKTGNKNMFHVPL